MLRTLIDARQLLALAVAAGVGLWGLAEWPFAETNPFLVLVHAQAPRVAIGLRYGYDTLCFTTPFLEASFAVSRAAIVLVLRRPQTQDRPLPPYP